jgi:hypothetical protein
MNKLTLFILFLSPFFCRAQLNDSFSDGDFTKNPSWFGNISNFEVNSALQLHSKSTSTGTSALFTPSVAFDNASWECWVKISYPTSSSNFAAIYLASDKMETADCKAFYVQIGGTNDEVALFVQEGTKKTKIIDGIDKRTDGNSLEIKIKVIRDTQGSFSLYSKLPNESEFILEGKTKNLVVTQSLYFGLMFSNTSTTGSAYCFDDLIVTGNRAIDSIPPLWNQVELISPTKLKLFFSEPIDFSSAKYHVDNQIGFPNSILISNDQTSVELSFPVEFQKGTIYTLQAEGINDLSGNPLEINKQTIGISESVAVGDLVLNEILFENPINSVEYVELYNNSDKLLDLSTLLLTTRKTDGTLNLGIPFPAQSKILPNSYFVITADAEILKSYYGLTDSKNIITCKWNSLNNEGTPLVLCNLAQDSIYDEVNYSTKWHHPLVKDPKGVALERIHPALPSQLASSWHSASSAVHFGTPGYQNSQFHVITSVQNSEKFVWVDPESFSPDNDGVNDLCFIRYKTDDNGYVASVLIFDANGNKVVQLAANYLLATDGFFTWDGKTAGGKSANVGIYILYFEAFNPITGARKQIKLPIVVSAR